MDYCKTYSDYSDSEEYKYVQSKGDPELLKSATYGLFYDIQTKFIEFETSVEPKVQKEKINETMLLSQMLTETLYTFREVEESASDERPSTPKVEPRHYSHPMAPKKPYLNSDQELSDQLLDKQ